MDRIGNQTCKILFTAFVAVGQGVFALGISIRSYSIALIGRCIFGLGGENFNISQFNVTLSWFSHSELSMTLSIVATINRLSTALNDSLSPVIVSHTSLGFTLLVETLFCIYSLICSLILKKIEKTKENSSNSSSNKPENFKISDFTSFNSSLSLLSLNCTFVYYAVYCFNNIASNYFQRRFNYSTIESGRIISIIIIICGLCCPIIGVLLDKYGQRIYFIIVSAFSVCLAYILFFLSSDGNRPLSAVLYMIP